MRDRRISLAPINTGLYRDGESTAVNNEFYSSRSNSGINLCIVGNISVSAKLVPNLTTGVISSSPSWQNLAEGIYKSGAIPGIQLSATLPDYKGQKAFHTESSEQQLHRYAESYAKISPSDWQLITDQFITAIDLSYSHGFRHIQIHAAHGYLFSIVLDPFVNKTQSGLNSLNTIIKILSAKCPDQASIRVSWETGLSYDLERQKQIINTWKLYDNEVELDLSNGYYNINKHLIYPSFRQEESPYLKNAIALAQCYPDRNLTFTGNVRNPYTLSKLCPKNLNFGLARPLIADPNHLLHIEELDAMQCDGCGKCHYYSNGRSSIQCSKWKLVLD